MINNRPTAALAVLVLALLSACSSQSLSLSQPTLPEALVEQIPLRVGIRYSEEMLDFTHREELLANQEWTVSLGNANKLLYDQIFKSMFSEVIELQDGEDPQTRNVDLVITPSVEAFQFALPQQSRSEAYTVWIRYRLTVYDQAGLEIASWPVNSYGKAGAGRFEKTKAMQRAAELAMRDAAALVSMRFATETGILVKAGVAAGPVVDQLASGAGEPTTEAESAATDEPTLIPKTAEKFQNDQG